MHNWSSDTRKIKGKKRVLWKLEQMINYGLDGGRISRKELVKYWGDLNIDPDRRRYLAFLLWEKKS